MGGRNLEAPVLKVGWFHPVVEQFETRGVGSEHSDTCLLWRLVRMWVRSISQVECLPKRCHRQASRVGLTSLVLNLQVREPRLLNPIRGAFAVCSKGIWSRPPPPPVITAALDRAVAFLRLGLVGMFSELPEVFRAPFVCGAAFESFRRLRFHPPLVMRRV